MNRLTVTAVAAIVAGGIAMACSPTVTPSVSRGGDQVDLKNADGSVSQRGAGVSFYDKAKKGHKATVASYYQDQDLGIAITNADISFALKAKGTGTKAVGDDEVTGRVAMEVAVKGAKAHRIVMDEAIFPPMGETDNVLKVDDEAKPNPMTYTADQDFRRFTITDAKGAKVVLIVNPDGSYLVNDAPGKTVADTAELCRKAGVFKGASVESLAALYGRLIKRDQAMATLIGMNGPNDTPGALLKEIIQQLQAGKPF